MVETPSPIMGHILVVVEALNGYQSHFADFLLRSLFQVALQPLDPGPFDVGQDAVHFRFLGDSIFPVPGCWPPPFLSYQHVNLTFFISCGNEMPTDACPAMIMAGGTTWMTVLFIIIATMLLRKYEDMESRLLRPALSTRPRFPLLFV